VVGMTGISLMDAVFYAGIDGSKSLRDAIAAAIRDAYVPHVNALVTGTNVSYIAADDVLAAITEFMADAATKRGDGWGSR